MHINIRLLLERMLNLTMIQQKLIFNFSVRLIEELTISYKVKFWHIKMQKILEI